MSNIETIKKEIKILIVDSLNLEDLSPGDIGDSDTLFGEGLGLDSIDALELGMAVSKHFKVKLNKNRDENTKHFKNVDTLAAMVHELKDKQQ